MPFYGDLDDYCPQTHDRSKLVRVAACAVCLLVLGAVVVL